MILVSLMASPIYQQIAGTLRQRINSGKYSEGDQIPPLGKLIGEFGASRMTVVKAIDNLEAEGFVKRYQGRGTFVNTVLNNIHAVTDQADDEIELVGGKRTSKLTACHLWQEKPPELERIYDAPNAYQYLARTMYSHNYPYHIAEYFVDADVYKMRKADYWSKNTIGRAIPAMEEFSPVSIRQIIKVEAADIDVAKKLDLDLNATVLHARRVFATASDNRFLCLALLTFRADMVRFETTIECSSDDASDNIRGFVVHDQFQRKS